MKICVKNEKPAVNKEDIWQGDLFERKTVAVDFTKIITSISQPFVLSVNATYGSGKTFFLERWEEQLKQSGEKTVFFNAWNCDFTDKPLLPFLYEFLGQLKEQGVIEYDITKDAEDVKTGLVKTGNEVIKIATGGIFDPLKRLEECSGGFLKIDGDSLDEYRNLKQNIDSFKTELKTVIESKIKEGKNIYVFIDELERCRPTFAIELLEGIKHIFNIKGLVFILGIDRNQLKHTVRRMYGHGMDDSGYLRKFIDLELTLPEPKIEEYTRYLSAKFCITESESITQDNYLMGENYFTHLFNIFARAYKLSLREIEQMYTEFNVLAKIVPPETPLVTTLLPIMLILRTKDFEYYENLGREQNAFVLFEEYLTKNILSKINPLDHSDQIYWNYFKLVYTAAFRSYDELKQEADRCQTDPQRMGYCNKSAEISLVLERIKFNHPHIFDYIRSKMNYSK